MESAREPIPEDCAVLAVIGPEQPFTEPELASIETWVQGGGRLIASTGFFTFDGPGSGADLLGRFGMLVQSGLACEPVLDPLTLRPSDGLPECVAFEVYLQGLDPRHPVTAPLVRGVRKVAFQHARPLERGGVPEGGVLLDLAKSSELSWSELPDAEGRMNYALDHGYEQNGPLRLCMAAHLQVPGAPAAGGAEEVPEGRVIGLACKTLFGDGWFTTNRDFLLNAFNWLASRDLRIRITPRDPRLVRLELDRGRGAVQFNNVAWFGLPGACVLFGLLTWLLRRRA